MAHKPSRSRAQERLYSDESLDSYNELLAFCELLSTSDDPPELFELNRLYVVALGFGIADHKLRTEMFGRLPQQVFKQLLTQPSRRRD